MVSLSGYTSNSDHLLKFKPESEYRSRRAALKSSGSCNNNINTTLSHILRILPAYIDNFSKDLQLVK